MSPDINEIFFFLIEPNHNSFNSHLKSFFFYHYSKYLSGLETPQSHSIKQSSVAVHRTVVDSEWHCAGGLQRDICPMVLEINGCTKMLRHFLQIHITAAHFLPLFPLGAHLVCLLPMGTKHKLRRSHNRQHSRIITLNYFINVPAVSC